jgi:hypothetical protein
METEQIHAITDEPIRQHKLFRGIMLSFLFSIIIMGFVSAFGQGVPSGPSFFGDQIPERTFNAGGIPQDRSVRVAQVEQALEINEEVTIPSDGISYSFKRIGETIREIFTFDRSDKEELNIRIIDERAKEIALSDARGEQIPDDVVKDYSDRIDRAEKFITLTNDDNENIDTRTIVRTALEEHKTRFLDRIQALEDKPSNTILQRVVSQFGDRITSIVARIDMDEVNIVKNTIPIVKQKQANIKLAEIAGDIDRIRLEMKELEEIDDKLNRLHIAKLCNEPIKTLSLTTFRDIERICPVAALMEDEIKRELDRPLPVRIET